MVRPRQMVFRFQIVPARGQLSAEQLVRCQELISQLMVQVLIDEAKLEEATDDREDTEDAS